MAEAGPRRVAVVDDHRLLLGALVGWLAGNADDLEVVIAAATWPEVLASEHYPPQLALLDLDLRDEIPLTLKLERLVADGARVVVMSSYSEPAVVRAALDAGASGYVVKSEPTEVIARALRDAADGRRFLSDELAEGLEGGAGGFDGLSSQERRVMALYAAGEPVKSVARTLGIGEETTKTYLKRIREKYRDAGIDIGTKVSLRRQAVADGLLVENAPPNA